jgi:hypothetical protein
MQTKQSIFIVVIKHGKNTKIVKYLWKLLLSYFELIKVLNCLLLTNSVVSDEKYNQEHETMGIARLRVTNFNAGLAIGT